MTADGRNPRLDWMSALPPPFIMACGRTRLRI
jgi:hypothetical protein